MYTKLLAAAAALIIISSSVGFARDEGAKPTPGHEMQEKGSVKGEPRASGYAPGHEKQEQGSKTGSPGASANAPGHESLEALDDVSAGRASAVMGICLEYAEMRGWGCGSICLSGIRLKTVSTSSTW